MRCFLPFLTLVCGLAACTRPGATELISCIDTRVGTDANSVYLDGRYGKGSEEYGQTLPAVLEPHGMNFWTPQTRDTERKCIAPYYYRDSLFQGFRNSHWIVGGCTQDYGSMTLFPSTDIERLQPADRATPFRHQAETATPSYYSVFLHESGIRAELTARSRSAIFRFTYPEDRPACLIVNPNSDEGEGYIELDTLRKEIRGYNPVHRIYQGWGQPAGYSGHFVIRFEDTPVAFGTFSRDTVIRGGTAIGREKGVGLYVQFPPRRTPLLVRAASSFTDYEGAVKNLEAEIPEPDFEDVHTYLEQTWEKHLARIRVSTEDTQLKRQFYGALYRASFLPREISDVDGRYPAFAKGTPVLQSSVPHYDDFSMWDTYRALHPLLTLLEPGRSGDMMQSLTDKYIQGGWLPIFPCWNSYTAAMIGDHCTAAMGDAWVKGVRNFNIGCAYEGMRKNAFQRPESPEEYADGMGRRALESYLQYGYIPLEDPVKEAFHTREQTSRTLEYAYDDFVLSQLALALGKEEDYKALHVRSLNYRNVMDPATGYAGGRHADGNFEPGVRPEALARFITEGAPCHYAWYVPQDPYGLMCAMGGREKAVAKLDSLFDQNLYWHGNEPCHQVAYMYNYAGQPWKTQERVRTILDTQYADAPGGLAGNDDAGQMSAWLVFSSLGFYPVCPGSPYYIIGSPQFDKAVLSLENGRQFILLTEKTGKDNRYIQRATLDGKPYTKNYLSHEDILRGGVLAFVMGDEPNPSWGSAPADCPPSLVNETPGVTVWELGRRDGSAGEFALAPDGYMQFLEKDFGYEDRFFAIGHSSLKEDFPYILPGPDDAWGGTTWSAGLRTHQQNILFQLGPLGKRSGYALEVSLAAWAQDNPALVKLSVNGRSRKYQLRADGDRTLVFPLEEDVLREGGNEVVISVLEGSWIQFDRLALVGPEAVPVIGPEKVFVREVTPAGYQLGNTQPLIVDVEHLDGEPLLQVKLDGKKIFTEKLEKGCYQFEAPMKAVKTEQCSRYELLVDGRKVAEGNVRRGPQRQQRYADYVDTRTGTAHSRWMIAPGPWMPFGMVKLSPDNQNQGWQAGYQPSFENIGCFSHVHEWTLGGLGVMPAVGPMQTEVGDERRPDEGYRSRMDKDTEVARIGYYSARLTDYGILAELTATTRCGLERFTFPAGGEDSRILLEMHPQAEYDFEVVEAGCYQVSPTRIEGWSHQHSSRVWRKDADQDYTLHFVLEFDCPVKGVTSYRNGELWAVRFDSVTHPVVQMRSAISPVSVANARENLRIELAEPFGWDFDAVVAHQADVWNDLLGRIEIETTNRLEKQRFYNNMYRSLCGRTIWSDVNGEWVSTDGIVRRVENPGDVMISSDAFWNTFWNLNQLWNLVTPEWSSQFVRTQLALYDANGWLGKGPAGLNYIPVMVAEHEIPLIVGAWQMGIRDFDAHKALEAAVKMETTPGRKVYKGFAGNRDLAAYLQHGYVPYDKGRFSNTMEYSFDNWAVGQLARSLGDTAAFRVFDGRGSWWKHVMDDEGYCHMKDSTGTFLPDFDPFRSGANRQYVEGNAWQLSFFVPQDVPGLIDVIGRERFTQRLSWGFEQDEPWRYNAPGDQYWDHPVVHGNQQSMHFAFLFNYAGEPWNTQRWSRSILERFYGYGVANAYLGDEDQGQMSAWAIMASLGLFQMDGGCLSQPAYEIGSPLFRKAVIHLGGRYGRGQDFVIRADGASRKHLYVKKARLNGKRLNSFRFPASELLGGGELRLEMSDTPTKL